MIFVRRESEPPNFDKLVRNPGRRFLQNSPNPTDREFARHAYWREVARDMYNAYSAICAYTCYWIARDTGWSSVEHFIPKSVRPAMAYEWSNYRLVCGRMNARKGSHQDVLDPFAIHDLTFAIRFPSLQVTPGDGVVDEVRAAATRTIDRLKLNDEICIASRLTYVELYCKREVDLDYLRRMAPFIHREIVRQELVTKIRKMMRFPGRATE